MPNIDFCTFDNLSIKKYALEIVKSFQLFLQSCYVIEHSYLRTFERWMLFVFCFQFNRKFLAKQIL